MAEASRQPVHALGLLIVLWIAAYWIRTPVDAPLLDDPTLASLTTGDRTEPALRPDGGLLIPPLPGAGEDLSRVSLPALSQAPAEQGVSSTEDVDWSPTSGQSDASRLGEPVQGKADDLARGDLPVVRTHTIRAGDTLGSISLRAYGSVRHADAIFRANRGLLRSPDALNVGMVLTLPEVPPS